MTIQQHSRAHLFAPGILALFLVALVLVAVGCGNDDPSAPDVGESALPDLTGMVSVSVETNLKAAFVLYDGGALVMWQDFGAGTIAGAWNDSLKTFAADREESGDYTYDTGRIYLTFDPASGAVDSLYSHCYHSNPSYSYTQSVTGRGIPLHEVSDDGGDRSVVWRIEGRETCLAVLDAMFERTRGGSREAILWSCGDDDSSEAYVEIRLEN